MGLFTLRFLILFVTLLSLTILLIHSTIAVPDSAKRIPLAPLPNYIPPAAHTDPPNSKPPPVPLIANLIPLPPKPKSLNEETLSDIPADDDEISAPGDEDLDVFELGRVTDWEAEEESQGDDWMESYEEGVSYEMYKGLEPEEDGDKVWKKHHSLKAGEGRELDEVVMKRAIGNGED